MASSSSRLSPCFADTDHGELIDEFMSSEGKLIVHIACYIDREFWNDMICLNDFLSEV